MSRNKVPTSLRPLRKSSSKTISKLMQETQGREKSVPFDSLCAREGVPHQSSYAGRQRKCLLRELWSYKGQLACKHGSFTVAVMPRRFRLEKSQENRNGHHTRCGKEGKST